MDWNNQTIKYESRSLLNQVLKNRSVLRLSLLSAFTVELVSSPRRVGVGGRSESATVIYVNC